NWFRKDADGKFLWPGFRENMRVLEWIVDRCEGRARGHETAIGWMPRFGELNFEGMEFSEETFDELMAVNYEEFRHELLSEADLYLRLYDHLPKELIFQRELLASRI
ncbi:MAG: phosphoenolpyruvate carboxykinase (GTP), partial [Verrucomicrobiae bacterium]|nr:phosphoenolpyruvate carboxykinase (GTP) [Verrucomicrobiae bacterium]